MQSVVRQGVINAHSVKCCFVFDLPLMLTVNNFYVVVDLLYIAE